MRRWFFTLSICFGASLHALYNGNPSATMIPETGLLIPKDSVVGVKLGYEFDQVFDSSMKMVRNAPSQRKRVQEFETQLNLGTLSLDLFDRAELYGSLGVMRADILQHPTAHTRVKYETHNHLAWSVGGRVLLAYWNEIHLGATAAYLQSNPPLSELELGGTALPSHGAKLHFDQWQVGFGVSRRIKFLIPYIGLQYSDTRARIRGLESLQSIFPKKHVSMKTRHHIGLFLGCGLTAERGFDLNLEGRFIGETALTASAEIRF